VAHHPTLKDIAQELNISSMTVSRALNDSPNVDEDTRERVIKAAKQMGYIPNKIAQSLVNKRTKTIGVVVPEIVNTFQPEVIRGIEDVTYNAGFNLLLTQSGENSEREEASIGTLISQRVDGILISTAETGQSYGEFQRLVELDIPFVFYDRYIRDIGASIVRIDDKGFASKMTRHLIGHGYRRIANIRGPKGLSVSDDRFTGYVDAMEEAGLAIHPELVAEAGFREFGGYNAMNNILELPEKQWPEAVFCVNDPAAFGALQSIRAHGVKVPDDIAIVGFSDDMRSAVIGPPLTTVNPKPYEQGKRAVQKLIECIERHDSRSEEIIVEAELIVRKSCGCI